MLKFLSFRWRKPAPTASSDTSTEPKSAEVAAVTDDRDEDPPHYPPSDQGIPVESVSRVLEKQREIIVRIKRAAGVSPETFAARFEPAIVNLAAQVHLLPATDNEYFVGPGGLLRMSLEIALHSLQTSQGSVFPSIGSVEKRSSMLPRWELASFMAGLCSQIYRPITNLVVTDRANSRWPQLLQPLSDWAVSIGATRYYIRWAPGADVSVRQSCSAYLVNRIIPLDVLQYLNEENNVIVPAMTTAITGGDVNPSENPIARIVAPITTRVIQEDMLRNSRHYGRYSLGIHLEPHLIDAMRRLIKSGKWSVNTKGSRIWVGKDGVFLVWGAAVKEIVGLLISDSFVGIPQDPDTLADILLESAVLDRNPDNGRYWSIVLPESGTLIENAVRLAIQTLIFPPRFDLEILKTATLRVADQAQGGVKKESAPMPNDASPTKKPRAPRAKKNPGEDAVVEGCADAIDSTRVASEASTPQASSDSPPIVKEVDVPSPETGVQDVSMTNAAQAQQTESAAIETRSSSEIQKPDEEMAPVNDQLLSLLSRESRWLVNQIAKGTKNGTLTGAVVNLDQGLGISDTEIADHGLPPADFLNDLAVRNWLWVDKARPLKKLHRIEVGNETLNLIILLPQVARGLGFNWEPPKS